MSDGRNLRGSEPWIGLLDQAVARAAGLASTVWLVRTLGLGAFGSLALANLVVLGILALHQALCVQPLASFTQLEQGRARGSYLRSSRYLAWAGALVGSMLGLAFTLAILLAADATRWTGLLPALGLAIFGRAVHGFARGEAYALRRPRRALALDSMQGALQLGLLALAQGISRLDVPVALAISGVSALVATLVRAIAGARSRSVDPAPLALGPVTRKHWAHGRWLALMGLAQWGGSNAYMVAAAAILGPAAAGAIRAAQTIVGAVLVLANALDDQLPVRLSVLRASGDGQGMQRALARWGSRSLGIAASASCAMFAGSGPVVALVYGPGHALTQLALMGLAWLPVGALLFTVLQSAFRAQDRTGQLAAVYLSWTAMALVIAEPIVERFGLVGATFGMSLQQIALGLTLALVWLRMGKEPQAPRAPLVHPR